MPGFICIVGQQADTGTLHTLEECFEDNMLDLARKCGALQKIYPLPGKRKIFDWIAPIEGEFQSFANTLKNISRSEGRSLRVYGPTIPWDLTLSIQLIRQELRLNSLVVPKNGILQRLIKNLNHETNLKKTEILDRYGPIMVLASIINAFGLLSERIERYAVGERWSNVGSGFTGAKNAWMGM
jgi:hypothetical protein